MRIYSDNFTRADMADAARFAGVYLDRVEPIRRPRVRSNGWNVRLSGSSTRARNSGRYGAEHNTSPATYDEHGLWMEYLFDLDPNARIACYDGREDFRRMTSYAFVGGKSLI